MKAAVARALRRAVRFLEGPQPVEQVRAPITTTWPAGHFYSPIINPNDPSVQRAMSNFGRADVAVEGISFPIERMLEFLNTISREYSRLPFTPQKQPGLLYYYDNPFFGYGDAIILALILTHFRPKRVIEVGSGFSSCVMIDMQTVVDSPAKLTFIEPFPDVLNGLLPEGSRFRECLLRRQLQAVPTELFAELGDGDILFIDSSHVAKTGSDVNYLFFDILPLLKKGVLIHIHDIFYPFDYPPDWIKTEGRSWNEAFLLRAFLQFNSAFEIVFFNHFGVLKFPDELIRALPDFMRNGGGSIWLRRVG